MPGLESAPLTTDRLSNESRKFCATPNLGRVAVRVCADAVDPLPVEIVDGVVGGSPHFADADDTTTAGGTKTLISEAVPAATTRCLTRVIVSCRKAGIAKVTADGALIGTSRTAPGKPDAVIEWTPIRAIATGVTIAVTFTQTTGTTTDIQAHLMATDNT